MVINEQSFKNKNVEETNKYIDGYKEDICDFLGIPSPLTIEDIQRLIDENKADKRNSNTQNKLRQFLRKVNSMVSEQKSWDNDRINAYLLGKKLELGVFYVLVHAGFLNKELEKPRLSSDYDDVVKHFDLFFQIPVDKQDDQIYVCVDITCSKDKKQKHDFNRKLMVSMPDAFSVEYAYEEGKLKSYGNAGNVVVDLPPEFAELTFEYFDKSADPEKYKSRLLEIANKVGKYFFRNLCVSIINDLKWFESDVKFPDEGQKKYEGRLRHILEYIEKNKNLFNS